MTKQETIALLKTYRYAHRGYHDKPQIPENSLPAFKRAIERGWGAEFDVHIIKDGSLVIFHDSELKRCAGVDGIIENYTLDELRKLRLEGTDNLIPTFDEVLGLFEEVNLPLIIELKCYKDNHKALAEAVAKRLDSYKAPYCIESFDPRAVYDYKNLRPDVVRGQLSGDMVHDSDGAKSYFVNLALTNLWDNLFTKPDFVAYDFQFRNNKGNQKWIKNGGLSVYWTIRSKEDLSICEKEGSIPIFEKFDPEK